MILCSEQRCMLRFHFRCDCVRRENHFHAWNTLKVGHIVDNILQIF